MSLFAIGTLLVICQFSMLTWGKVMLPETTGYWADPLLADWEASIFGGDLWRALHFADFWWIEYFYNCWLFVILSGVVFFLARNDDRAIVAFFLTMAVGVVTIYLSAVWRADLL